MVRSESSVAEVYFGVEAARSKEAARSSPQSLGCRLWLLAGYEGGSRGGEEDALVSGLNTEWTVMSCTDDVLSVRNFVV